MSSFCKCKSYSHFFSKNTSVYAIFNNQSFNDTLTDDIFSFEQLSPDHLGQEGAGCFAVLWFVACVLSVLVCLLCLLVSLVDCVL